MAKKTKTEAPAKKPSLAQLKKEVTANMKKKVKKERFLFKLEKPHFNEELSSPSGFGAQDLQEPYFSLYSYLLLKHKTKLVVKLISMSNKEIELWVKETK